MKFNILGFNHKRAIEFGLNIEDLLILRWFIDFKDTGAMERKYMKDINNMGFWVSYDKIISDLPILFSSQQKKAIITEELIEKSIIANKKKIQRKLKGNLSKIINLEHKVIVSKGGKTYISLNEENYKYLLGVDTNVQPGVDANVQPGVDTNVQPYISINNTSININIYSRVIDYLNEKAKTKYKSSSKKTKDLIKARVNEGFTEEDFIKVIDNKSKEWINTEMEKYLRPETLFGTKFEGYLNQKEKVSYGTNGKFKNRCDFGKNKESNSSITIPESKWELSEDDRRRAEELI